MAKVRRSACVRIPPDVPVGAVIGKGGRHSKMIASTHGVRFTVDSDARTVTLSGSRNGVDGAVNDLTAQLERYRLNQQASRGQKKNAIHSLAVARHGNHCLWSFRHVDADTSGVDPSVRDATFRLEEIENDATEQGNAQVEEKKMLRSKTIAGCSSLTMPFSGV